MFVEVILQTLNRGALAVRLVKLLPQEGRIAHDQSKIDETARDEKSRELQGHLSTREPSRTLAQGCPYAPQALLYSDVMRCVAVVLTMMAVMRRGRGNGQVENEVRYTGD